MKLKQLNIRLTRRMNFPSYWPDSGANVLKANQRLSSTPYTFENLVPGSHSFVVKEILQCSYKQVVAGSLRSPGKEEQDNLILKVFKPTLFPIRDKELATITPHKDIYKAVYNEFSMPGRASKDYTDKLVAWSEVYAYSKMSSLQGTVIPRLIGTFMVMSPQRDAHVENIAIVMERLRGESILDRCRELGSWVDGDTRWYPIALELCRKVYEIHQLGVIGLEINDRNILVVDGHTSAPTSPSIKLFDFASSRPNHFDKPEDMDRHVVEKETSNDVSHLSSLLMLLCGIVDSGYSVYSAPGVWNFLTWARREHPGDPWIDAWWYKLTYLEDFNKTLKTAL